jgi:hypothetical protein
MANVDRVMGGKKLSSCITGSEDQDLRWRSDSLMTENRTLYNYPQRRICVGAEERKIPAEGAVHRPPKLRKRFAGLCKYYNCQAAHSL